MMLHTKSELRKIYLEKRKSLSKIEITTLSQKIIDNFILQFNPIKSQKIHCFLPIERFNEVNTLPLLNYCKERGIRFFVPKMLGENLISIEITENIKMKKNSWGILEPTSNKDSGETHFEFVITPLLYCDVYGNRIGYGKGFYDGLFSNLSRQSQKVGVGFFPPNEEITDIWKKDVPLDYLITPELVLSFGITTSKSTK